MPASFSPIFDNASSQAAAISDLFKVVLVICGMILVIVVGMVGISLIRFRQQTGAAEPRPFFGNRKLEIIWTGGPLFVISFSRSPRATWRFRD
jgi:heme/copper-type cytochrome/quinol oxidase subunit 2